MTLFSFSISHFFVALVVCLVSFSGVLYTYYEIRSVIDQILILLSHTQMNL